jgi:hypothetical protein
VHDGIVKLEVGLRKDVKDIQEYINSTEIHDILEWISRLDFANRQKSLLSKRHEGTSEWLAKTDQFAAWRNGYSQSQNLWCPGIRKYNFTTLLLFRFLADLKKRGLGNQS